MRIILFLFVLSVLCLPSYGQNLVTPWNPGEFTLNDGVQFKGVIKYNPYLGSITYQVDSLAKESRTFIEKDIMALSFFDRTHNRLRRYYSFPIRDHKQKEVILFFEVIKEFNSWAILLRMGGVQITQVKDDTGWVMHPLIPATKSKVIPAEFFYIMDDTGDINYFFVNINNEESGFLSTQKTRSKMVDEDFLFEKMRPITTQVKAYAEENELRIDQKEGLFAILDYYESLVKQE